MNNLALYIHFPFCAALCPYCDFNVHIKRFHSDEDFLTGINRELELLVPVLGHRKVSSIFFGGGTPSLMQSLTVEKIITSINKKLSFCDEIEISLEANPENASEDYFKALADCGISRLSLGVQSLNDDDLKFLGRKHSAEQAISSVELALSIFSAVSFDLIYALPQQNLTQWEVELKKALSLSPNHLSLYQLDAPHNTHLAQKIKTGEVSLPKPDDAAILWERSENLCAQKGLYRYEISNYAQTDFKSKHNLSYWHYQDYIGLGAGAHGRIFNGKWFATKTPSHPRQWLDSALSSDFTKHFDAEILTNEIYNQEKLIMRLRLVEGIKRDEFKLNEEKINNLCELKLLQQKNGFLTTTSKGALVLDAIIFELINC